LIDVDGRRRLAARVAAPWEKEDVMPARTPEEIGRRFAEAFNAGDVSAVAALYEANAVYVSDGQIVRGRESIGQMFAGFLALKARVDVRPERTVTFGDDLAAIYSTWTASGTSPEGDAVRLSGRSVEVARRQADGTWLYALDDATARNA